MASQLPQIWEGWQAYTDSYAPQSVAFNVCSKFWIQNPLCRMHSMLLSCQRQAAELHLRMFHSAMKMTCQSFKTFRWIFNPERSSLWLAQAEPVRVPFSI